MGSTKNNDAECDEKCCNPDGSCKCKTGYASTDCNSCADGYYAVMTTTNGENKCGSKI